MSEKIKLKKDDLKSLYFELDDNGNLKSPINVNGKDIKVNDDSNTEEIVETKLNDLKNDLENEINQTNQSIMNLDTRLYLEGTTYLEINCIANAYPFYLLFNISNRVFFNTDIENSFDTLISTLNNVYELEIPSYEGPSSLYSITVYTSNLTNNYADVKLILFSSLLYVFSIFAVSIMYKQTDGHTYPVDCNFFAHPEASRYEYKLVTIETHYNSTQQSYVVSPTKRLDYSDNDYILTSCIVRVNEID